MMKDVDGFRTIQKQLSRRVIIRDAFRKPLTQVAGIDLAFTDKLAITACVITSFPNMKPVHQKTSTNEVAFPYIPTFLSFREGPPIIKIINSLEEKADVFLINAHGLAHPLYCGCASHVGVLTGVATIGVAASNLCGVYAHGPQRVGEAVATRYEGRQVGWILQSQERCRPIFVSPGHKIGQHSCLKIVKKCIIHHKLPEPLWLAHRLANEEKRRLPSLNART
jgi:deoxyribonuclease V